MNKKANFEAIKGRIEGRPASRYRAAAIACAAGVGVGVALYRSMRGGDE
jgi:hypothetical protein